MTTGRINQVAIPFHITGRATGPTKGFLPNGAAAPLAGEIRAKTPGCNSRVKPPKTRSPRPTPFSPGDAKLPIRAPLQGSVPPSGSAVVQCMFIPSALIHTLLGNQGLCPRRSTRPPLRPTQKWPPSLLSASSPARPKPQNHGPSPSPTSPIVGLAECFALPVAIVEVCRVQPKSIEPRVGALRRALLYRGGSRGRV
jgi:hypothetical protein